MQSIATTYKLEDDDETFYSIMLHVQKVIDSAPYYNATRPKEQDLEWALKHNKGWVKSWTNDGNWWNYGLVYAGSCLPGQEEVMPLLQLLAGEENKILMAGYSLLYANGAIPLHSDENAIHSKLNVFHLGLICSDFNYLLLEETAIREEQGKVIWFDDARKHAAVNLSENARLILYIKIEVN